MKRNVIITMLAVFASTSFARFSEFVRLTPDVDSNHNLSVTVSPVSNQNVQVKFKWSDQSKKCWLIVFKDDQSVPDNLDFREIIWNRQTTLPSSVTQLIPLPNNDSEFIEVTLKQSLISHAFICVDFPSMVLDGGYYYTVDLRSFLYKPKE